MDLSEYSETVAKRSDQRRRRCHTCMLPPNLRVQVADARHRTPKPISFEVISKWLEGEGHKVLPNTLRNHFVAGHPND